MIAPTPTKGRSGYSRFTLLRSPFLVRVQLRGSLPGSWFGVRGWRSVFGVRGSLFVVRCSRFGFVWRAAQQPAEIGHNRLRDDPSHVKLPLGTIALRTSNVADELRRWHGEVRTPHLELRTSNVPLELRTCKVPSELRTPNSEPRSSNFEPRSSNFEPNLNTNRELSTENREALYSPITFTTTRFFRCPSNSA